MEERVMKEIVADSIVLSYEIEAGPARIFDALTKEIGSWWTHSFKKGKSVKLEPRVGGRFYEEWGDGTGALYAHVTYIEPPVKLRLMGPMGMSGAVASCMEKTRLTLTHDILGTIPRDEVESYRSGWKELLGVTLRAFVERSAEMGASR
jgi:uncharacterized protein YndB with AHSA1/START domain